MISLLLNELLRDAEFDNNEFDRNTEFASSQDARTLAFGTKQTDRNGLHGNKMNALRHSMNPKLVERPPKQAA